MFLYAHFYRVIQVRASAYTHIHIYTYILFYLSFARVIQVRATHPPTQHSYLSFARVIQVRASALAPGEEPEGAQFYLSFAIFSLNSSFISPLLGAYR